MADSVASQANYVSEAEYLAGEKQAEERHEYVNGQVTAMAGSSKRHNRIAGNLYRLFAQVKGCEAYISDMKVRIEKARSYYYPDVVLGCEPDESDAYVLEHPCVIVEVTSESTLRKDYLEKTLAYQSIASLKAYLIVAQDKVQVDILLRGAEGWVLTQYQDLGAQFELSCVGVIKLADMYQGVL